MKARRAKKSKNKNLIMMVLITLFIGVIAITGKGTYAYFTAGEKILPAVENGTPVYNQFTVNYTDHTDSQAADDGVTVYFDISTLLVTNGNWNAPHSNIYFLIKNGSTELRRSPDPWSNASTMILRFDSISTVILPTDTTKYKTTTWISNAPAEYPGTTGGITWSGCWLKYKITDSKFDLKAGETRYLFIRRDGNIQDQTANNMTISAGVKEVYIKANPFTDANTKDWKKLEIYY